MDQGVAVEFQAVTKRFNTVTAVDQVSLQINEGEFFSLLGPSGCGKTTSLRMVAGFEYPTQGDIKIDGKVIDDLPPYKRPVNTVFQNYALFPHMTVYQNIAFGLEMEAVPEAKRKERVAKILELVQLPGMGSRWPKQLSGGQQQRVALARALVKQPKVLLLDEPLGALDLKLRKAMQIELKTLQHRLGITFIYVTHDQEEALTMSDRIAVMNAGAVLQVGTPHEIYEQPVNRFVADFIGETNFIPAKVESLGSPVQVSLGSGSPVPAEKCEAGITIGQQAFLSIRPEKIQLYSLYEQISQDTGNAARVDGKVVEAIYLGTDTRYVVSLPEGVRLVARLQNTNGTENRFRAGDPVQVCWDAHHAHVLKE